MLLVLVGLVIYFQFIKPLQEQKAEIQELSGQSKKILNDITGTLKSVVEEKYNQYHEQRLANALNEIQKSNDNLGRSIYIIQELKTTGATEGQLIIVKEFLENITKMHFSHNGYNLILPGIYNMLDLLLDASGSQFRFA